MSHETGRQWLDVNGSDERPTFHTTLESLLARIKEVVGRGDV